MDNKPNIIFTTPVFEYPTVHGPSLRIINLLIAISKIANVTLLLTKNSATKLREIQNFAKENNINYVVNFNLILSTLKFTSILDILNAFLVNKLAKTYSTNIVWLGYGCMNIGLLKFIKFIYPKLVVICDTDSVQSKYFLRGLPYIKDKSHYAKFLKLGNSMNKLEKSMVNLADITLAVSEVDQKYYQSISHHPQKIKLLYNAIDILKYEKAELANLDYPAVVITGWFGKGSPMEDGATWLIQKIWPKVVSQIPKAKLYLIGKGATSTMTQTYPKSVIIVGEVANMVPYLKAADVSVVPLRYESGTRFKILESAASGLAVVSTTLGAEGLTLQPGKSILIGNTSLQFAECIMKLLRNKSLRNKIAINAKAIISEKYSLKTITNQAQNIISGL